MHHAQAPTPKPFLRELLQKISTMYETCLPVWQLLGNVQSATKGCNHKSVLCILSNVVYRITIDRKNILRVITEMLHLIASMMRSKFKQSIRFGAYPHPSFAIFVDAICSITKRCATIRETTIGRKILRLFILV